jgi:hypothetical protein
MSIVQCSIMNVPCLGLPNRRITNHLRILDIHESRIANQLPQKTPSLDRPSSSSPPVSCISSFHAWVCILPTSTIHIPSADVETSHFNYPHQSAHWRSNVKTKQKHKHNRRSIIPTSITNPSISQLEQLFDRYRVHPIHPYSTQGRDQGVSFPDSTDFTNLQARSLLKYTFIASSQEASRYPSSK